MKYGIMFFSGSEEGEKEDTYDLLINAAKYADDNDFDFVSTPERHFHQFGGLFPNPAVTSAALATITNRIQLRAGSLISPLHDAIRIVEEWSVVDKISRGRAALSFGAGWNVNDFVFFPERYDKRQSVMHEQIARVKQLWRGEPVQTHNSFGKEVSLTLWPKPVQKEIPIWVTTSGNIDTFTSAGKSGANILTHLIGQDIATLAEKITHYRNTLQESGFPPEQGTVTLMLHTFVGSDVAEVKEKVRKPFKEYLRTAVSLEIEAAAGGGAISGGHKVRAHEIDKQDMEDLLDVTFERYFSSGALMGTPDSCQELVFRLQEIGVDEVACLIDFLADQAAIMESLESLNTLRIKTSSHTVKEKTNEAINAFMDDLEM